MKKIFFCNSLSAAKTILGDERTNWHYLILGYTKESSLIESFLIDRKNCRKVLLNHFNDWKEEYLEKFVGTLGKLNTLNSNDLYWWGLDFTNKNPILTPLCNSVFYSLFIAKMFEEGGVDNLMVISGDRQILKQLRIWFKKTGIKVVNKISPVMTKDDCKAWVRRYTPCGVLYAPLRVLAQKLSLRSVHIEKNKSYAVILSLLNHQSFKPDGSYEDTYFGELADHIAEQGVPVINFLYVNTPEYKKVVDASRKTKSKAAMFPLEHFLGVTDIIFCFIVALYKYFIPAAFYGVFIIDGKDAGYLVRMTIRNDYSSPCFFDNLRKFFIIKNISRAIKISRFYYPFENRAFEKMVILALRRFSPGTKVIGYQHAALSMQHTNFLLTKEEAGSIPLPDKIMTMGKVTRDFMRDAGNFPDSLLESGCALRQKRVPAPAKNRREISNLLVTLATNLEEYVQVMIFLNESLKDNERYKIWIRPHPRLPLLEEAMGISGELRFSLYKSNKETLPECLEWADVVLNVCSTVAIEGLARGIPVIYLNINNIFNSDPVINFEDFRWQANTPGDLHSVIRQINELPDNEFYRRQKKGLDYAADYLCPVNENNLNIFLKA